MITKPDCDRIAQVKIQLGGFMNDYLRGVTEQWLLIAPRANPAPERATFSRTNPLRTSRF